MVERKRTEVDDTIFPLASASLVGRTIRLSGTVESLGRGKYRGLRVRFPIELSVTKVLSDEVDVTSGVGALILESAESFDGGLDLIGVVPCIVPVFTSEQSQLRLEESERPVAFRRWLRWHQFTTDSVSGSNRRMVSEDSNMVQPVLPILVANNEDDDLDVAPFIAWAVGDMEPPEVSEGYFLVLDATGRRGYLEIDRFDIVIERWDSAPDVSGHRSRINRCLRLHSLIIDESLNDPDYVQEAARLIFDENRKNQWRKWPGCLRKKIHGERTLPNFSSAPG